MSSQGSHKNINGKVAIGLRQSRNDSVVACMP